LKGFYTEREKMINVIASVYVKEGLLFDFLKLFKSNIPNVLAEKGCIEYMPMIDISTGIPHQELNSSVVTVIEKWDSLEDLQEHLSAPHMIEFRKKEKNIVNRVSLKVLKEA
jgi:quinol monooxygenase YgiN